MNATVNCTRDNLKIINYDLHSQHPFWQAPALGIINGTKCLKRNVVMLFFYSSPLDIRWHKLYSIQEVADATHISTNTHPVRDAHKTLNAPPVQKPRHMGHPRRWPTWCINQLGFSWNFFHIGEKSFEEHNPLVSPKTPKIHHKENEDTTSSYRLPTASTESKSRPHLSDTPTPQPICYNLWAHNRERTKDLLEGVLNHQDP